MNPLLRNSEAHVFVKSLDAPSLSFEDEHHLDRVLRLEATDPITISDGQGKWATATWSRERGVTFTSKIHEVAKRSALTVGLAIPKGDRPELVVQKLTELGVDKIVLLHCERSVVRWDGERAPRQLARVRKVAREAAMQSRRTRLAEISGPATFSSVAAQPGAVLAEPEGVGVGDLPALPSVVIVGPEGGFSVSELQHPIPHVRLSEHILRVETAALLAAVSFLT